MYCKKYIKFYRDGYNNREYITLDNNVVTLTSERREELWPVLHWAGAGGAGLPGGRGRDSAWNVTAATEATGAATAVTGGEERIEAEAGDEDRQEGETQPPLAQLPVTVITGTDILV